MTEVRIQLAAFNERKSVLNARLKKTDNLKEQIMDANGEYLKHISGYFKSYSNQEKKFW